MSLINPSATLVKEKTIVSATGRKRNQVETMDDAEHVFDIAATLAVCRNGSFDGAIYSGVTAATSDAQDISPDCTPKDLGFSYNSAFLMPYGYDSILGSKYECFRVKSLGAGNQRSLGIGHAAKITRTAICEDGTSVALEEEIAVWRGGEFHIKPRYKNSFAGGSKKPGSNYASNLTVVSSGIKSFHIQLTLGAEFTRRLNWAVRIGLPNRTFRLECDRTAIKEFFADRNVGPSGRKQALRTWVKNHWRRKCANPDTDPTIWIKEHLRGATRFDWNGLPCEVEVSESDLAKAKRAK
jgi:hypothetical protein